MGSLSLYPYPFIPIPLSLSFYPFISIPLSLSLYPFGPIPLSISLYPYPRKLLQEKTDVTNCVTRQGHTQMMIYRLTWSRSQPRKVAKSWNLALHIPGQLIEVIPNIKKVHSMDLGPWIIQGPHQLHPVSFWV